MRMSKELRDAILSANSEMERVSRVVSGLNFALRLTGDGDCAVRTHEALPCHSAEMWRRLARSLAHAQDTLLSVCAEAYMMHPDPMSIISTKEPL
jgi:hypothetical protein